MDQDFPVMMVFLDKDGELRTTSLIIASQYGVSHASVIKLVRKYQGELESFGLLGFEIQVIRADVRGGEQAEIALLNEHQAALLLSLMRNSVRVVEFKVQLIAQFASMAQRLANHDETMWHKRLQLEVKDKSSFAKGQAASRLMLTRRLK